MSQHSVVEAKNNLSDLIARAERGEAVVITRHGAPVVELKAVKPVGQGPRPMTEADLEWLDANRIKPKHGAIDSATLVRQMRDEGY